MTDDRSSPDEIALADPPVLSLADLQRIIGDDTALVVTSGDPAAGGLFAISGGQWEVLDTVPTVGLAFNGEMFVRGLYSTLGEPARAVDEILWYDSRGLLRLERIDGVYGLHDFLFDPVVPGAVVFVATGTNAVHRLVPGRPLETILHPGAVGDAGHRNCLARHGGLTYVTAFSTMANRREWNRGGDIDTGVLIEIETQRVVVEGLCMPHSPLRTRADDGWIFANSGRAELIWVFDDGVRVNVPTGGWPQDVIRCGEHLIVGVCSRRKSPLAVEIDDPHETARLLIFHEDSRTLTGWVPLRLPRLYDLVLAPDSMVHGLRVGSATNTVRMLDRSIRGVMSDQMQLLDDNDELDHFGEVSILAAPRTVVRGDDIVVRVRVVYRGARRGKTIGDKAMRLGISWPTLGREERHIFQTLLVPHQELEFEVVLLCPDSPGTHRLEVGLLQESVAWFGEKAAVSIEIVDRPAAESSPPAVADGDLLVAVDRRGTKRAAVDSVKYWWHSIDLGDGVVTPGRKSAELLAAEWQSMGLPSLAGKSVLDIGAWDGYFSFAAERHGAERVVAVDDFVWAIRGEAAQQWMRSSRERGSGRTDLRGQPELWDHRALRGKRGFDVCHEALSSRVEPMVANYMDLDPEAVGTFDVVLYLGVLYHEPNPVAALERVRSLTRGLAIIETSAVFVPGLEDRPLAEFHPNDELSGDATNWWSPTLSAVRAMADAVGFSRTVVVGSHPPEWRELPPGNEPQVYRLTVQCHVE